MPIDSSYVEVADRIRIFRDKYPEGSLQPADLANPYRIEHIGERVFVSYVAAAYRTPDDPCPGIGAAWEPFPGPTNFTKDSELQNAETSAWGRAIVAALAADTKHVASANEVRNRQASQEVKGPDPQPTSKGNERRGPRVLPGWVDYDEQRGAHDAYKERALEELDEPKRAELKAAFPEWPMTAEQMTAAAAKLQDLADQLTLELADA